MSDSFLKLIEIVQRQTELVDKGWAYYSTVTLAVLGIVIGADRIRATKALRFIVLGGYVVFAVGNLLAILQAQTGAIRYAALLNRQITIEKLDGIIPFLNPFPLWEIALFHLSIGLAVTLVIAYSNQIRISHSKH